MPRIPDMIGVSVIVGSLLSAQAVGQTCATEVGFVDTPGEATSIEVQDGYAYVADGVGGLRIIDISDPRHPMEKGSTSFTSSARYLAVQDDHTYVSAGDLEIVDVQDSTDPQIKATLDIQDRARGVAIDSTYAYVLDFGNTTGTLRAFDVSSPASPTPSGSVGFSGHPFNIAISGNLAFVASTLPAGLGVVDISDPALLSDIGKLSVSGHDYFDLSVQDDLVFVSACLLTTSRHIPYLDVVDVSDPSNPSLVKSILLSGDERCPAGSTVDGNLLYVALPTLGIQLFDISDPTSPISLGLEGTPGSASDVAVAGDFAYVADGASGVRVFDVSCLSVPTDYGTTVITHGYQKNTLEPNGWTHSMAKVIRERAGLGRIFEYQPATGTLDKCPDSKCGPSDDKGETVIISNWALESDINAPGYSEAAGEALFAALVQHTAGDNPLVDLSRLHLIGHSRGAVVNSEVAERLVAAGLGPVDHVTTLDTHDMGWKDDWTDYDVNQQHKKLKDYGVWCWKDTNLCDNYFHTSDNSLDDLTGRYLLGAANLDLTNYSGISHRHVHTWYHCTVPFAEPTDDGDGQACLLDEWYSPDIFLQCSDTPSPTYKRSEVLSRQNDGYKFSRIRGGRSEKCAQTHKADVEFQFNLEGIVNGDFERFLTGDESEFPGWSNHGGSGEAELDIDSSRNVFLLVAAGQKREHNRTYIPRQADGIGFCYRIDKPDENERLVVYLRDATTNRQELVEIWLSSTPWNWNCTSVPLDSDDRGSVLRIGFEVTNLEGHSPARVHIDNVNFVSNLFADGFESGDTSSWSSTVQ